MVEPLAFIVETLTKFPTLRASRLYQMVRERGYPGAADHFRTIVSRLRPRPTGEAYLRLRTLPGEQGQVDWAHFGKLTVGRAVRPLMAFVMVLSYSLPVSALLSQRRHDRFCREQNGTALAGPARTDPREGVRNNFLRGHVEAFAFFNSVPRILPYDNLKSAVLERVGEAIRFHPTLLDLAAHYHFQPRPVAPARRRAGSSGPSASPARPSSPRAASVTSTISMPRHSPGVRAPPPCGLARKTARVP